MFVEQIIQFELKSPDPMVVHVVLNWFVFMTKKNRPGKFLSELLDTTSSVARGRGVQFQ